MRFLPDGKKRRIPQLPAICSTREKNRRIGRKCGHRHKCENYFNFFKKGVNMSYYNFQVFSLKHSIWKAKLRDFLEGKQSLTREKALSHKDCDLGKWLYTDGLKKYEKIPGMQKLEKVHEDLHATVRKIIFLKESGDPLAAEVEYKKIEPISDELVSLLAEIAGRVKSMG
jgi:hypothetical protein